MGTVNPPQSIITSLASVNLAINGDFETGVIAPWTPTAGTTIVSTNPHSGTYCLDLQAGGYAVEELLASAIPVSLITSLKVYYRQTGNSGNPCYFRAIYSDLTWTTRTDADGTGAWKLLELTGFLTAGKSILYIYLQSNLLSDTFFDDATLTIPNTRGPPSLLLTYQPQN